MPEAVKRLIDSFWYLRGVGAAFSLFLFVPQFVALNRLEVLVALRAALASWGVLTEFMAKVLGSLVFMPDIQPIQVSAIVAVLCLGVPAVFSVGEEMFRWRILADDSENWLKRAASYAFATARTVLFLLFVILILFACGALVIIEEDGIGVFADNEIIPLTIFLLVLLLGFWRAVVKIPAYKIGVFTIIGFVLTVETLYWLNIPGFRDAVLDYVANAES